MAQVIIQEMVEQHEMGTGDHVWIDVVFLGGKTLTIRVDEQDIHVKRPRVFLRVDDETGKEVIV
jgi:hypothetical protein